MMTRSATSLEASPPPDSKSFLHGQDLEKCRIVSALFLKGSFTIPTTCVKGFFRLSKIQSKNGEEFDRKNSMLSVAAW